MHKQAIKHKQAIIGGGYLFTENACFPYTTLKIMVKVSKKPTKGSKKNNFIFCYASI